MAGKSIVDKVAARMYGVDKDGYEHPDPTPVEVPTRLKLPQRQVDRVREIIRREMSLQAQEGGYESFEEADDFELPGEDPVSPYEEVFEPPVVESSVPRGAAKPKENENGGANGKDGADGDGKASGGVVARSGDKGAGKAGGKAVGTAGSSGGAGGPGAGSEGDPGEGQHG